MFSPTRTSPWKPTSCPAASGRSCRHRHLQEDLSAPRKPPTRALLSCLDLGCSRPEPSGCDVRGLPGALQLRPHACGFTDPVPTPQQLLLHRRTRCKHRGEQAGVCDLLSRLPPLLYAGPPTPAGLEPTLLLKHIMGFVLFFFPDALYLHTEDWPSSDERDRLTEGLGYVGARARAAAHVPLSTTGHPSHPLLPHFPWGSELPWPCTESHRQVQIPALLRQTT